MLLKEKKKSNYIIDDIEISSNSDRKNCDKENSDEEIPDKVNSNEQNFDEEDSVEENQKNIFYNFFSIWNKGK